MHPKLEIDYYIPTENSKDTTLADTKQIKIQEISISVYPNPVKNSFNIEISEVDFSGNASFILYDSMGLKIKQIAIDNVNTSMNVSDLTQGIYLYKISDKNKRILKTGKIIINK